MRTPRAQLGIGFWLFLLLMAVYLLSYSGGYHSVDELSVTAMTATLVKEGRVSTDQIRWSQGWTPSQGRIGPDGHLYSKKGLGSALLAAPFYWLGIHIPQSGAIRFVMLANAFVTALTAWLLYRCVLELDYRPTVAVLTALAYGLGTMAWPYAKYLFSEPLTTLGLVLALLGLLALRRSRRQRTGGARFAFLAGVGLGLALLAKVANGVAWPFFVAYGFWIIFHRPEEGPRSGVGKGRRDPAPTSVPGAYRLAGAFLAPLVLTGLVLAAYNLARTGQLFDLGYAADETFSTPLWLGLSGFLFSPGKSLFLFSPILLAALFGIPALLRQDRATALLSLAVVVAYPLLYAGWFMWWGGWSWGPRFLVPILPFFTAADLFIPAEPPGTLTIETVPRGDFGAARTVNIRRLPSTEARISVYLRDFEQ